MTIQTTRTALIVGTFDISLPIRDREDLPERIRDTVNSVSCSKGEVVDLDYRVTDYGDVINIACDVALRAEIDPNEEDEDEGLAILDALNVLDGRIWDVNLSSVEDYL
jgi:hypothetical protein